MNTSTTYGQRSCLFCGKQAELDAAREKVTAKVAEPVALKHLQKENTRLKSYVKELEERLQACGAMV